MCIRDRCIVFIDEIDTIGKKRDGAGFTGGNDEREQTLNQLLTEMDGFDGSKGVVILAATNRPDSLDPALLRPGRFDRRIPVELPDLLGREEILKVHAKKIKIADTVRLDVYKRQMQDIRCSDLRISSRTKWNIEFSRLTKFFCEHSFIEFGCWINRKHQSLQVINIYFKKFFSEIYFIKSLLI